MNEESHSWSLPWHIFRETSFLTGVRLLFGYFRGNKQNVLTLWCHLRQGRDPRQVCRLLPQFTDIAEPRGANCGTAHGQQPQVHHWQECGLCQQGVRHGHLVQQSKHGQGITPVEICRQTAAAAIQYNTIFFAKN